MAEPDQKPTDEKPIADYKKGRWIVIGFIMLLITVFLSGWLAIECTTVP